MPGFTISGLEVGGVGANPPSLSEVRRTHRWVFETLGYLTDRKVMLVLKSASRPSFQFDEPSMHHNQEEVFFAGKHKWEPLSLTFYDVEQAPDVSAAIYQWLGSVITIDRVCVRAPGASGGIGSGYKDKLASLKMVDGCGKATEEWKIYNGWPQSVNWNSLDYTSSDLQLIEVKYRFDRAVRVPDTQLLGSLGSAFGGFI